MAQTWAPLVKDILDRVKVQVDAQWTADQAVLAAPLGTDGVDVVVDVNDAPRALRAVVIQLLPPHGPITHQSSMSNTPTLSVRAVVNVRYRTQAEGLKLLREAVGLVIDGVNSDFQLNGKADTMADPPFILGPVADVEVEGRGVLVQEVELRFVKVFG